MRASDEGLHAYLRPSVLCDRSPPPSAAGDEDHVGAVDVHSLRTQVQALLAARLLDRRTIRELREAAGGSRDEHTQRPRSPATETRTSRNPARGAPPHTAHRLTSHKRLGMTAAELVLSSPSSIGSSSSLSSSRSCCARRSSDSSRRAAMATTADGPSGGDRHAAVSRCRTRALECLRL